MSEPADLEAARRALEAFRSASTNARLARGVYEELSGERALAAEALVTQCGGLGTAAWLTGLTKARMQQLVKQAAVYRERKASLRQPERLSGGESVVRKV